MVGVVSKRLGCYIGTMGLASVGFTLVHELSCKHVTYPTPDSLTFHDLWKYITRGNPANRELLDLWKSRKAASQKFKLTSDLEAYRVRPSHGKGQCRFKRVAQLGAVLRRFAPCIRAVCAPDRPAVQVSRTHSQLSVATTTPDVISSEESSRAAQYTE